MEEPNFFKKNHQGITLKISAVWIDARHGKAEICYKLEDGSKHRAPRKACKWLDEKDRDYALHLAQEWQRRHNLNNQHKSEYFPPEFEKLRKDFEKYLLKTARATSIYGYVHNLGQTVFPYFHGVMNEPKPENWYKHYHKWETWLSSSVDAAYTRNHCRTALRRFLKFLYVKGKIKALPPMPVNEVIRKSQREVPLPGKLPNWDELAKILELIPPGKERWVITVCAAFGVRVSEALATEPRHLVGQLDIDNKLVDNMLISKALETKLPQAFLAVDEAVKREVPKKYSHLIDPDDERTPKTGSYVAVCTSKALVSFLVQLIERGEFEGKTNHNKIYNVFETLPETPPFHFNKYSSHDLRRLHITLTALEMNNFWLVSQLHGHASEDTTRRYYQWGKMQVKDKLKVSFKPISYG